MEKKKSGKVNPALPSEGTKFRKRSRKNFAAWSEDPEPA